VADGGTREDNAAGLLEANWGADGVGARRSRSRGGRLGDVARRDRSGLELGRRLEAYGLGARAPPGRGSRPESTTCTAHAARELDLHAATARPP